jgi:hypothetical protein
MDERPGTGAPGQVYRPNEPLFDLLMAHEKDEFYRLAQFFAYTDEKNKRNYGLPTFIHHLSVIHQFVVRGDQGDVVRGIVCGIEFTPFALLLNTGRLKRLMGRSKSCMNGCFQKLGYQVFKSARDIGSIFAQIYPRYSSSHNFVGRQWCIRRMTYAAAVCFIPNLNVNLLDMENLKTKPKEVARKTNSVESPVEERVESPDSFFDISRLLNHKEPVRNIHGVLPSLAGQVCY